MSPRPSRFIAAVLRHRHGVLVIALVVTLVAAWRASRLELDSDLRTLLPADHPVITELHRVERGFGFMGALGLVVEGGTTAGRRALADALVASLAHHPLVEAVEARIDDGFVRDHALYYLHDHELAELRARVDAWQHLELCTRARGLCLTTPDAGARERLEAFLREQDARLGRRAGLRGYYDDPERGALVVFVHPNRPASDVEFDIAVTRAVREHLDQLVGEPGPWSGSGLRTTVVGPYAAKADETLGIRRDIVRSGVVGAVGVGLVLWWLFGSGRAVLALLVPLGAGVAWSLAAAELMLGHLSVLTSLVSAVLMGLGIDAGIHLLTRYRKERHMHAPHEAIARAFGQLMRPLLVASGTTACAFAALAASSFVGFRELGLVAATGVGLCLLAMLTVLPALVAVLELEAGRPPATRWRSRWLASRPTRRLLLVAVVSGIALASAVGSRHELFERSSRRLQSDAIRSVHEPALRTMVEVLGRQVQTAMLVVDDHATLERAHRWATQRHQARRAAGESVVAELSAAPDLMPPPEVDQAERHAAIVELAESLSERTWARLEGSPGADEGARGLDPTLAAALRRMLRAEPFGPDELPPGLTRRLRGRDGSWAIHAHPDFDPADMLEGVALIEETAGYVAPGVRGVFVGETILYASMVLEMREQWPWVMGLAVGLVVLLVVVQPGGARLTLVVLLPVVVGLVWLWGLMGAVGLRLTLLNLAVLPLIVGIGVDSGIYLHACLEVEASERAMDLALAVRAILATTATTMVGFGALGIADSAGLRGIGWLALAGTGLVTVAALLLVPALARR